ncbi:MAG: TatD family hydrolase [Eubacteriales bacterium]|nr:TatD family hydrolase [Eubacteriales bacterium]
MLLFETHAHYDDEQYDGDREELLPLLHESGIAAIVNIACDEESNARAFALAQRYPYVFATVGYHPCDCGGLTDAHFDTMRARAANEKVVAVGEIGLDYHWDDVPRAVQQEMFIRQLDLARDMDLPVVIHSREAAQDTFDILRGHGVGRGVMHCYAYSTEMAREYIKRGYMLGIGGVVTFKNAKTVKAVVEAIPLEHLVLETDSPYLTPSPYRGKRNSSAHLIYVAEAIAKIKGTDVATVCEQTFENALRLYGLDRQRVCGASI